MIIRTGTEADYRLLSEIEGRSDRTFLRLPGFEDMINEPRMADTIYPDSHLDALLFIAETQEPIGFVYARDLDDCSHIIQISVIPEAQGRGAGTALLDAVVSAARSRQKRGVTLTTFRDVSWNAPFYARRGFHIIENVEMGPDLAATFAEDVRHMSRYGTRCAMGFFFPDRRGKPCFAEPATVCYSASRNEKRQKAMTDLRIVVIAGAAGRMGQALLKAVLATGGLTVSGALERPDSPAIGKDLGTLNGLEPLGVTITADVAAALDGAEAVLDFTAPASSVALSRESAARGLIHVIGTTGCSPEDENIFLEAAGAGARIVRSGNFSLGVNLLLELVKKAASVLGPDWDAEILEMHHNKKVDAPSGTALMLGRAVAEARGKDFEMAAVMAREGQTGPREKGTIGFAALRGGNVIGEHSVYFVGPNERIEITHKAQDRALFADGAVRAALWAREKPAGYYSMADVLGF